MKFKYCKMEATLNFSLKQLFIGYLSHETHLLCLVTIRLISSRSCYFELMSVSKRQTSPVSEWVLSKNCTCKPKPYYKDVYKRIIEIPQVLA